MRSRRAFVWVVAASLAAPSAARADPHDTRARADSLFREGRRAASAGDFDGACAKFAESQRLDPSTGTLLNLGDCEEHRGHLAEARNYYETALAQLGRSDPRVSHAEERLAGVEARMPRLTIRVGPSAPSGTIVTRDGVPVVPESFGVATPVDPGAHVVVVTAPGYAERRESVVLEEGESRTLLALPGDPSGGSAPASATPAVMATPPMEDAATPNVARTAGWIVGGVGVLGLVVAGTSGIVLLNEKATVSDHCPRPNSCDATGEAAANANRTWLPINTVAWVVAAAGAGVGAYLILSSSRSGANVAVTAGASGASVLTRVAW